MILVAWRNKIQKIADIFAPEPRADMQWWECQASKTTTREALNIKSIYIYLVNKTTRGQ